MRWLNFISGNDIDKSRPGYFVYSKGQNNKPRKEIRSKDENLVSTWIGENKTYVAVHSTVICFVCPLCVWEVCQT